MLKWWYELHKIMGTKLLMSMLFHLQTDGATEQANRSIGQMFRVMVNPDQKDWVQKSALIEFTINSSIGSATGLALFEINCRYMPIIMTELRDVDKAPPVVQMFAQQALHNMAVAHDTLIEAQVFQTYYAYRRWCKEPDIKTDDLVYLSKKNMAMPKGRARKLMPKFIGPYRVMKTYPETSNYMLELPPQLAKR
jgi:hypothetical protein